MKVVQCVPNISEGKDLEKIARIVAPLKNREGFNFISVEADADYNRSVITIIGDPDKMINPLIEFIKVAQTEIDLNYHKGEHARMGAVDVLPFIPINNITIDECTEYANILGKKVFEELSIPVFLYSKSAKSELRESLPTIRKGEFEGMKEKIKEDLWTPDFGSNEIHPTFGVLTIGARLPLIAYNIDLDTNDEKIARSLAKTIRKSSGGFTYVQAGPASLKQRGHTQVTMNILDYLKNPIYRILETIKMEGKRYGVTVTSSEIVGLVPKDTIVRSLNYYLSVEGKKLIKDETLEEISDLAVKYLLFRDFNKTKIVEAYLGDSYES